MDILVNVFMVFPRASMGAEMDAGYCFQIVLTVGVLLQSSGKRFGNRIRSRKIRKWQVFDLLFYRLVSLELMLFRVALY